MAKSNFKILFVFDMEPNLVPLWQDGLWAALERLNKKFLVTKYNLQDQTTADPSQCDFVLGWGGFNSPVDLWIQRNCKHNRKGLCLGGYGFPPTGREGYGVVFYETPWSLKWLDEQYFLTNHIPPSFIHAFGTNTDIYHAKNRHKYIDFLSVGAFSAWKRQSMVADKPGVKLVIGQIQLNNISESTSIISNLVLSGVGVMDMVSPIALSEFYNASETVYIPAEVVGGGERSVLEAVHCGCLVEVEEDNPKLVSMLQDPVALARWDEIYYAEQLEKGIKLCLK